MTQGERHEGVDPRTDSSRIAEQASRAVSFLFQDVADREARARKAGELLGQITERFDAYDRALSESRRREADSDERASGLEAEIARLRDEHGVALAALRAAHAEELSADRAAHAAEARDLSAAHAAQMEEAARRSEEDARRMRDGVERLKEDLGRRFALMEGRLAEVEGENAGLREENESLVRSITTLVTAVEAQARSLQAEEGAIAAIVETFNHRDKAPGVAAATEVIPFPQRQIAFRDPQVEDAQYALVGRSA